MGRAWMRGDKELGFSLRLGPVTHVLAGGCRWGVRQPQDAESMAAELAKAAMVSSSASCGFYPARDPPRTPNNSY